MATSGTQDLPTLDDTVAIIRPMTAPTNVGDDHDAGTFVRRLTGQPQHGALALLVRTPACVSWSGRLAGGCFCGVAPG
jgi:hypothetical protein